MKTLLFVSLVVFVTSIYIPLSSNVEKCMVAFSFSEGQSLKLELKFPMVPKQDQYNEVYTVSLRNSQTNETQYENVTYGVFKRELHVQACKYWIIQRVMDGIRVQYSAVTHFYYTPSEMNIPQNLLKQKDLGQTYKSALQTQSVSAKFQQMQQKRTANEQKIFAKTKKMGNRLIKLSVLELIGILGLGVIQFFVIRGFINKKILV